MTRINDIAGFSEQHGMSYGEFVEEQNRTSTVNRFLSMGFLFVLEIPEEVHNGKGVRDRIFEALEKLNCTEYQVWAMSDDVALYIGFKTDEQREKFIMSRKVLREADLTLHDAV